jgi:4-amino-4-deoxy-L-arabinose transferase
MRYCEIPREMISSGDWIVPHLDGLRYFEKPPLGYWLIAASMKVCGRTAFAARLPSALAAGISAVLIGVLAFRCAGGRKAAGLAVVIFLTCFQVYGLGTFNVLDSMFSACVTGAMVALYFWLRQPDGQRQVRLLLVAGSCCGLAFLVKGFVGFVVPLLVILPFATWERKWKTLIRAAWLPTLVAILIGLPWCIAIAIREPDFWRYFVWVEHVQRFTMSKHGERVQPFWYLWVVLMLGTFPWNVLLAAIVAGCRKIGLRDSSLRFLLCWAVVPFLFFEVSKGKLGTYILPCYPPLAMLMAVGLLRYAENGERRLISIGAKLLMGTAIIALGLVPVMVLLAKGYLPLVESLFSSAHVPRFFVAPFGPEEGWKAGLAACSLAVWCLLLFLAVRTRDAGRQLAWYAVGPVLGLALTPLICPVGQFQTRMPEAFLRKHAEQVSPNTTLVCNHDLAYAAGWQYERDDVLLLHDAGELDYGLSYADAGRRVVDVREFIDLVKQCPGGNPVLLIMPADDYARYMGYMRMVGWDKLLPKPVCEVAEGGLLLFEFRRAGSCSVEADTRPANPHRPPPTSP